MTTADPQITDFDHAEAFLTYGIHYYRTGPGGMILDNMPDYYPPSMVQRAMEMLCSEDGPWHNKNFGWPWYANAQEKEGLQALDDSVAYAVTTAALKWVAENHQVEIPFNTFAGLVEEEQAKVADRDRRVEAFDLTALGTDEEPNGLLSGLLFGLVGIDSAVESTMNGAEGELVDFMRSHPQTTKVFLGGMFVGLRHLMSHNASDDHVIGVAMVAMKCPLGDDCPICHPQTDEGHRTTPDDNDA